MYKLQDSHFISQVQDLINANTTCACTHYTCTWGVCTCTRTCTGTLGFQTGKFKFSISSSSGFSSTGLGQSLHNKTQGRTCLQQWRTGTDSIFLSHKGCTDSIFLSRGGCTDSIFLSRGGCTDSIFLNHKCCVHSIFLSRRGCTDYIFLSR